MVLLGGGVMKRKRQTVYYKKSRPHARMLVGVWFRRCVVISCLIGLLLGMLWLGEGVAHCELFDLHSVKVEGEVSHVNATDLQEAIRTHIQGNFFTINIAQLRQALVALPWVKRVTIRRLWPDTLRITIIENTPIARWGSTALLTKKGDVLSANTTVDGSLPLLQGPPDRAEQVYHMYQEINQRLMPLHLHVQQLLLTGGGDWQVTVQDGMRLQLGSRDIEARLQRLVQLYPRLATERGESIAQIDLRYHNGLAVRWRGDE